MSTVVPKIGKMVANAAYILLAAITCITFTDTSAFAAVETDSKVNSPTLVSDEAGGGKNGAVIAHRIQWFSFTTGDVDKLNDGETIDNKAIAVSGKPYSGAIFSMNLSKKGDLSISKISGVTGIYSYESKKAYAWSLFGEDTYNIPKEATPGFTFLTGTQTATFNFSNLALTKNGESLPFSLLIADMEQTNEIETLTVSSEDGIVFGFTTLTGIKKHADAWSGKFRSQNSQRCLIY